MPGHLNEATSQAASLGGVEYDEISWSAPVGLSASLG